MRYESYVRPDNVERRAMMRSGRPVIAQLSALSRVASAIAAAPSRFAVARGPRTGIRTNRNLRFGGAESEMQMVGDVDPSLVGSSNQALGWNVEADELDWPSGTVFDWASGTTVPGSMKVGRLVKNGGTTGCGGWIMHQHPTRNEGPGHAKNTLSIGFAVNGDIHQAQEAELIDIARTLEETNAWPEGDLFDEL